MAKVALIAAAALVVVLIGGICAGLAWRVWRQHEVARLMAITSPPGIDEGRYVRIGGIEQWITIRGQDRRNPVILMIDGGPGAATSVAAPSALEKDFVLVEWDQPGAGKTYGRSGPLGRDDTIERLALDGIALADQVRHDLKRDKVILVGVSWGSIVGVRMALARPDLFTAYIGTGQFANMREGDALAYASTMAKAKARRDTAAIRTLEQSGPPPYRSQAQLGAQRRIAIAYEPGAPSIREALGQVLTYPRYSVIDVWNWLAGFLQSQDHFLGEDMQGPMTKTDLPSLGTTSEVPVFFFQGDDDDMTPAVLARGYLDKLSAPRKVYEGVPGAGHFVFVTHGDAFARFIKTQVGAATAG